MSIKEERNKKAESMHRKRDKELKEAITKLGADISKRLFIIESKVDPMYELFNSASGFNKISLWVLKALAMVGGAILGLYGVIEFFRRIGKP